MTGALVFATGALPQAAVEALSPHCSLEQWPGGGAPDLEAMRLRLHEADAVLVKAGHPITADMLDARPQRLKIVANIGVGYNNIDIEACARHGIAVTNTPDVLDDTVADLVVALLLSASRRIAELDRWIRNGAWKASATPDLWGMDLTGTTLGIVGMGRIGEAVARRARHGFGMNILYHNRNRRLSAEAALAARLVPLPELLGESDHIVLLAPYSQATHRLIGADQIALMKPTATFVNASRGQLVDEAALIAALETGAIRAAGLDVFEREPLEAGHALLRLDNVTLTPHIGSATVRTRTQMALRAAENVKAALLGQIPRDVVAELRGHAAP